jgi:hypothetical protein
VGTDPKQGQACAGRQRGHRLCWGKGKAGLQARPRVEEQAAPLPSGAREGIPARLHEQAGVWVLVADDVGAQADDLRARGGGGHVQAWAQARARFGGNNTVIAKRATRAWPFVRGVCW